MLIESHTNFKRDEANKSSGNIDEINDSDLDMLLEDLKMMDEEDISDSDVDMR